MKKRDSDKNPFEKKNLVKLAPEQWLLRLWLQQVFRLAAVEKK